MERFTISLDDQLAQQFDSWLSERSYANRSEAVRDLLRAEIGKSQLRIADKHCVACLSYVFNHHERELAERLTALHHAHHDLSLSTTHVHLDHDHCLETSILRGPTQKVVQFSDLVCAERGVHHGKVNIIGVELHEPHGKLPGRRRQAGSSHAGHLHLKPGT